MADIRPHTAVAKVVLKGDRRIIPMVDAANALDTCLTQPHVKTADAAEQIKASRHAQVHFFHLVPFPKL